MFNEICSLVNFGLQICVYGSGNSCLFLTASRTYMTMINVSCIKRCTFEDSLLSLSFFRMPNILNSSLGVGKILNGGGRVALSSK